MVSRSKIQLQTGAGYVIVQFVSLGVLLVAGAIAITDLPDILLLGGGLLLGVWAFLALRRSHFRVTPTLDPRAHFVTSGPYKIIRHPMYASLLLLGLGCLAMEATPLRMLAWIILLVDLLLKLEFEEDFLLTRFPGYRAYTRKVKRLIPFIY